MKIEWTVRAARTTAKPERYSVEKGVHTLVRKKITEAGERKSVEETTEADITADTMNCLLYTSPSPRD